MNLIHALKQLKKGKLIYRKAWRTDKEMNGYYWKLERDGKSLTDSIGGAALVGGGLAETYVEDFLADDWEIMKQAKEVGKND